MLRLDYTNRREAQYLKGSRLFFVHRKDDSSTVLKKGLIRWRITVWVIYFCLTLTILPISAPEYSHADEQSTVCEMPDPLLRDIHFSLQSSEPSKRYKLQLRELALMLKGNEGCNILLAGHTDEHQTSEFCLSLGDREASAVKTYLVSQGVERTRIKTISYGKEKPLCREHTKRCWKRNKRVQIVITKSEENNSPSQINPPSPVDKKDGKGNRCK